MEGMSVENLNAQDYARLHWTGGDAVALPRGEDFLRADFSRSGPDLLIETPGGGHFVVVDYFMAPSPPALHTAGGGVLSADVVARLAGPLTPAMFAQAAGVTFAGLGEPIGQVSEVEGSVSATHADGVQVSLAIGDPIFQGDVVETGAKGNTSIVFIDDTIFSLNGDGRMVIDEMVYDPGSQTGTFNTQVVQGVFSFVSGKIAKTSPDGMVLSTPTSQIGIRGSTGLLRAGPEGFENKITLIRDVDGNVGEIVITNAGGTLVLNQAGASTTVFSINGAPTPIIILSPQQIQQDFGENLSRLVKVVAKKAEADAQRATEKAQQSDEAAQQADAEAQQAEDDAAEADQAASQAEQEAADAEAAAQTALDEAAAAQAEAEAAGNAEAAAKAAAAEQKAAEAAKVAADAKVEAEAQAEAAAQAKVAAEAKAAEADAKIAEAEAAQAQAQQAQQFNAMADTAFNAQAQAFEQFQQTQPQPDQPPPGGQQGDQQDGQQGDAGKAGKADTADTADGPPPEDGPPGEDGDAAAKAAYEKALAEGASPEEAFNAAAMAASGGNMNDPAVAAARAAFEEAIAGGASPEEAMLAAQGAVNQFGPQQGPFDPNQPPPVGFDGPHGPDEFGPNPYGPDTYGPGPYGPGPYGPGQDGPGLYGENQYGIYNPFDGDFFDGQYDNADDPFNEEHLTHQFSKTIVAPHAGGTMVGDDANTNFYFRWGTIDLGAAYTISDAGGSNQIAFDTLNAVSVKVVFGAVGTAGDITVYNDTTATHQYATVAFSNIHQFLLSDVYVASFNSQEYQESHGGDVLVLGSMSGGETGYVIAGTNAAETLNITNANYANMNGAIVFAKGGGDTININITTGGITVIGGVTSTDNVLADQTDYLPDSGLNTFDFTGTSYTAGTNGLNVTMHGKVNSPAGDANVSDRATGHAFHHDLWDVSVFTASAGNDLINVNSGYFHALDGGAGADTINIKSSAYFYRVDAGAGNDTVSINANFLTTARSINGNTGTDTLKVGISTGGTIDLSTGVVTGFEHIYIGGSGFNDTLIGTSGNDTFIGGSGADTMTGGAGADIFVYTNTVDVGDTILDYTVGTDSTHLEKTVIGDQDTVWDAGEFVKLGSLTGEAAIQAAINANGHTTGTAFAAWNQTSNKFEGWYDAAAATTGDASHVLTYDNVTLSQFNAVTTATDVGLVLVDTTVYSA